LMANCGMYSGDIGQLRKDEIDLQAGTIERARSKNKDKGGRVVTYKLWPETLRLLKAHLSTHPTLALSTQYGTALCRTEAKANGKPKHTDNISQQYRTWCRNNGHQLPRLKDLRKTGATLITNEYGKPLADYYLSRGLQDLSDVSYIAHQNDELAKALTWLGERYGQ